MLSASDATGEAAPSAAVAVFPVRHDEAAPAKTRASSVDPKMDARSFVAHVKSGVADG